MFREKTPSVRYQQGVLLYVLGRAGGLNPSGGKARRVEPCRSSRSFVNEMIRRRKLYPAILGQHFNRCLQLRLDADYRLKGVSQMQATRVVRWAQEFVAAITQEVSYGAGDPDTG